MLFAANLLASASVPVALFRVASLGVCPVWVRAWLCVPFILGLYAVGPFAAYLLDRFKRKDVGLWGLLLLVAADAAAVYLRLDGGGAVALLFALGAGCSLTQVSLGGTMANDLAPSAWRDVVDLRFALSGRLGLLLSPLLFAAISLLGKPWLLPALPLVALLFVLPVRLPFRAPLVLCRCSTDRFWLCKSVWLWLSVVATGASVGVLLAGVLMAEADFTAFVGLILFLSVFALRPAGLRFAVPSGFVLFALCGVMLATGLSPARFAVMALFGLGIGLATMGQLAAFLNLSSHCQRATVQQTYYLGWATGLAVGLMPPAADVVEARLLFGASLLLAVSFWIVFRFVRVGTQRA